MHGTQRLIEHVVGKTSALPTTARHPEFPGQALNATGAGVDGLFDVAFSHVVADADVHGGWLWLLFEFLEAKTSTNEKH